MQRTLPYGTLVDALLPRPSERVRALAADAFLVALGVGVMILCSQVRIPWHPVPFTGGTFGALLVGGALGLRRGVIALVLYLALGATGLGVFQGWQGGWDYMTGATGGYLVGFVLAAGIVGFFAGRGADRQVMSMIGVLLVANVAIYAVAIPRLANWTPPGATESLGWSAAYDSGVEPFVLGDLVKLAAAGLLLPGAWALTRAFGRGRGQED